MTKETALPADLEKQDNEDEEEMHSLPDESSDGSQNVSNSSFKSINKSLTNHAPTTPTLINQKNVSSFRLLFTMLFCLILYPTGSRN